nr:hypothetical protein [uncultured Psychroserpens sp.]
MGGLESFGISLGAGIIIETRKIFVSSEVKVQIERAFEESLKEFCINPSIREKERNEIKAIYDKTLKMSHSDLRDETISGRYSKFFLIFESKLVKYNSAYRYLKEARDEIRFLELKADIQTIKFELKTKYKKPNELDKKHSFLEVDSKNTIISKYMGGGLMKGHICILFYGLKIVNASQDSFTIKDFKLEYTLNSKKKSIISNNVITGNVYSDLEKKQLDCLIVYLDNAQIVLMGWENIRIRIGELQILQKNGVLSGSALFILDIKDIDDIRNIKDLAIVVSDYSNNHSKHKVEIDNEWIQRGKNSIVEPKKFSAKDGVINYA